MAQPENHRRQPRPAPAAALALAALTALAQTGAARAQHSAAAAQAAPASTQVWQHSDSGNDSAWRRCATISGNDRERLACFDAWAAQQRGQASGGAASASANDTGDGSNTSPPAGSAPVAQATDAAPAIDSARSGYGCRDPRHGDLARFWELEAGSGCGILGFRGYRPITVSLVAASNVNRQPTSDAPGHSASTATTYRSSETRIQLSVRTKLAQDLLTRGQSTLMDSLWFGYTQQSYWQLFTPGISRPFRTTDHEPEFIYVYPTSAPLPFGWHWRYSAIGLVHQSNGQSLPLSRSWNRSYLMTGLERGRQLTLNARLWQRVPERADSDDNPAISDYLGRGELALQWHINPQHSLGATLRHTLAHSNRGALRLEWLRTLGTDPGSNLRLHTALFSGYGDSLIDYNRKRTVFSLGLSLVDF